MRFRLDPAPADIGVERLRFYGQGVEGRFAVNPSHILIILIKIDDVHID